LIGKTLAIAAKAPFSSLTKTSKSAQPAIANV